jgi:Fur family transcriptional regulator, stress-responsive regulator
VALHEDQIARLRDAGLRITAPRLAVMEAVRKGDHPAVEDIAVAARKRLGSVSTQAVYDVLGVLTDAGLVRRIEPAGSPARFEDRVGDNHHHLVCRSCGTVTDVDCVVGHAPCLEPASAAGYEIDEAEVVYWGVCPDCRTELRKYEESETQ